jgi:hypothetical protein
MLMLQSDESGGALREHSFANAMDWRFFLPISPGSRILLIDPQAVEYVRFFDQLGFSAVNSMTHIDGILESKSQASAFDAIIAPRGLLFHNVQKVKNPSSVYQAACNLLRPEGVLFMGFLNSWRSVSDPGTAVQVSSPGQIRRMLALASFKEIKLLGLTGDLAAPDYILPLEHQAIGFVLHHKYRHKVPARFANLFFYRLVTGVFSNFFGSYFVTAVAPGEG